METGITVKKEYVYRKHLRVSYPKFLLAIVIAISFIAIGMLPILFIGEEIGIISTIFLSSTLITSIILIVILSLEYLFLFKRFKAIKVTISEDYIIYKNSDYEIVLPYEHIEAIKFPSIKYTGGWVKIVYNGGNIRLTVVLENIGDFICELKNKLDSIDKSDVYKEKKMFSFFKTASFSDESWDRIYCNIKFMLGVLYVTTILSVIISIINQYYFGMFGVIAPIIGLIISEIITMSKMKKRVEGNTFTLKPRDIEAENKRLRRWMLITSIMYIVAIGVAGAMF